jgi:catechol 2,3-dioxygenase-like lactoylglutathione lyase family enzyme
MGIKAVSHVAVGVRSMERSLPFWRDVLGLPVVADQEESFGDFGGRRHAVYLRWGDETDASFVVLDEQLERPQHGEPAEIFSIGVHHFGFWVDDVETIAARARDAASSSWSSRRSATPGSMASRLEGRSRSPSCATPTATSCSSMNV